MKSMTLKPSVVRTKSEAAYDALREAILDKRLQPGQRLLLNDLAAQLGMSLTPVRDALRVLAAQGLVRQDNNRGTWVAEYSPARAGEIYQLRLLLEPHAIALAAELMTDAAMAEVDELLSAFDAAYEAGKYADLPDLNTAFHRRIYQVADSPYLLQFIDRLWNIIPYQSTSVVSHPGRSDQDHHRIVEALHRRDPEAASEALRRHISNARNETIERLESTGTASDGDVLDDGVG